MARPVSSTKKRKLFHDFTGVELWSRLQIGLKHSRMGDYIKDTPHLRDMLEAHKQRIHEDDPQLFTKDRDRFLYMAYVFVVRHLLSTDNNWLVRWISNPDRLSDMNIVKEEFLKFGPSALPAHYKHAEKFGGIFRWSPNARKTIIMTCRGIGKSHTDNIVRSIFNLIRNPNEKCLIGQSAEEKAKDNLKRIKDALFHPNLSVAYPEFFVDDVDMYNARGATIRKDKINVRKIDFNDMFRVIDETSYMRGESSFDIFSPNIDVAGRHYDRCLLDDFATESNTRTKESADKITQVFRALTHLEEYKIDEKTGNMIGGKLPFFIINTQYTGPNFITDILDNDDDVTAFVIPSSWSADEHKTIYSYCTEHEYRLDPLITNEFLLAKKQDSRTEADFLAQYYQIPKDRTSNIDLARDLSEFVFAYSDETVSDRTPKVGFTFDKLHKECPIILSKDPSYSKVGKRQNDGQSNDVCVRCAYKDGVYYFTGEFSELGNLSLEGQKRGITSLSLDFFPEYVILDSHGTQIYVANQVFNSLKENEYKGLPHIQYIPYTKKKESDTPGKAQTIQAVLSALFQSGTIKVHWKLGGIIKQVLRENKGFDFLDAMVQVISIPKDELDTSTFFKDLRNQEQRQRLEEAKKEYRSKRSTAIFKTTGY